MLDRTKTNLKYYKIKPKKIFKADATKLSEHLKKNSVEAITCDPPYGQSSTTSDKNLRNLFRTFMIEAHKVLTKKGRLVIIIPSKLKIPGLIPKEFKRLAKFDWYVHGGLTRQIVVLEK
jgi:tRNA G10  N-methylase Trm11